MPADQVAEEASDASAVAVAEFQVEGEARTIASPESPSSPASVALEQFAAGHEVEATGEADAAAQQDRSEGDLERLTKVREAQNKSRERLTSFQKIARMGVRERIQLAVKGSKEERFILIRDGARLVSSAVLTSPKLTEPEVEQFAFMKNVSDTVLREIARNHKFMKNYNVVRNLANNPRTPLDISLTLVNHLMIGDLKNLSSNKNVADTLRKLAFKRFKDKTEIKKA